jgi:hypothetical protein
VANVEKMLPRDYITPDGFGITAKAANTWQPLIQGEDYPPYVDGLPRTSTSRTSRYARSLKIPLWYSPAPFFRGSRESGSKHSTSKNSPPAPLRQVSDR